MKNVKNYFIFTGIIFGFVSIIAMQKKDHTKEIEHLVKILNEKFEQWETTNPQQG